MKGTVRMGADFVERICDGKMLRVEGWTDSCIRVRYTMENELMPYDWAIRERVSSLQCTVVQREGAITLTTGRLAVDIEDSAYGDLDEFQETPLRFYSPQTGKTLLQEKRSRITLPDPGHDIKSVGPSTYRAEARFVAFADEHFYGLGQNQQDQFDQKGCSLELRQMNSHTVVPVMYSSRGYAFFWNNPAYGRVELAKNGTYWIAERTDQLDYFVLGGRTPPEVMKNYAELTGYPSMMPKWATGFWQCKLRYRNRDELMRVAEEHKNRGLPISVIVIDFFHWTKMGEWDFDPSCWPHPETMLRELKKMGIETMVSIWPTVNADSTHFGEMLAKGYLVRAENGLPVFLRFTDTYGGVEYLHVTDFTNPEAAAYVWQIVKQHYYDRGVRLFWLDECEPEVRPYDTGNMRYHVGNGAKYSSLYPFFEERAFYEGMKDAGEQMPINLCRSAWAGSQKYGVALWSGDIFSSFEVLSAQIKNGLNVAMSGIPWWTTDIGGFFGGKTGDGLFRELIVRWFQWGVFCPIFRLHGFRDSWDVKNAGDNEVWSFGDEAYRIIRELLFMRERLKSYVIEQMGVAHKTGVPPLRPLFFDFPDDPKCYEIGDELLFGPDILAAPVAEFGKRSRAVYLPRGARWKDAWSGKVIAGGEMIEADAPIERIPIFLKDGKALPIYER